MRPWLFAILPWIHAHLTKSAKHNRPERLTKSLSAPSCCPWHLRTGPPVDLLEGRSTTVATTPAAVLCGWMVGCIGSMVAMCRDMVGPPNCLLRNAPADQQRIKKFQKCLLASIPCLVSMDVSVTSSSICGSLRQSSSRPLSVLEFRAQECFSIQGMQTNWQSARGWRHDGMTFWQALSSWANAFPKAPSLYCSSQRDTHVRVCFVQCRCYPTKGEQEGETEI